MIELIQYNAALAITGTIRGSSREKLYQELGLESLHDRRWHRKLCFYYQIRHNICPSYLTELLPIEKSTCYNFWSNDSLMFPYIRTKQFKSTFFPSCIFNWNQLNPDIKNSSSLEIFKQALLKFIRPKAANVYKIHHPRGLKLLTRLRLGLSHLREHKFCHNLMIQSIHFVCVEQTVLRQMNISFCIALIMQPYASNSLTVFVVTISWFYPSSNP